MTNERELTAADILNTDDTTVVPMEIPEWKKDGKPGVLYFKVMTADQAIKFQELLATPAHRRSVFVRLLADCACDSQGNLLFKTSDLEQLRKKQVSVFVRMQKFLLQLNGMASAEKTWDDLETILRNVGIEDADQIASIKQKWEADVTQERLGNS